MTLVDKNGGHSSTVTDENISFLKENLADWLTLSRGIIGLVILSLSFIGKGAYVAVVILALFGIVTDMLDGIVARRYLGENREGKMGKHDVEIDTFFVLCIMGYLSFSGILVPRVLGLGWIGLALMATVLFKRDMRVLVIIEVPTVIALLVTTMLYNLQIFATIIAPVGAAALIINRRRVLYLIIDYWPALLSRRHTSSNRYPTKPQHREKGG